MRQVSRMAGQGKPAGGYVLVRAGELLSVWEAYRAKIIRLVDLRVWLACKELVARRTAAQRTVLAHYGVAEVHRLVGGVGGRRLEGCVRRLEAAHLLRWSESAITFPATLPADAAPGTGSMARLVPVPRRLLRFLAGAGSRVLVATVLGHLLRCVYYRRGTCSAQGACKASWVAEVFGVDERNVKRTRARLVEFGWLTPLTAPQWRMNRWGGVFRVNLSWNAQSRSERGSPPPAGLSTTQTPPPESDKHPLREYRNQKPAERGPRGVCKGTRNRMRTGFNRVAPEDLRETPRLCALHQEACEAGLASPGDAGRLAFVALAEHASAYATRNPCGLFAWLIRRQAWEFVTSNDEDRARDRLRVGENSLNKSAADDTRVRQLVELVAQRFGVPKPVTRAAGSPSGPR